MTAAPFEIGQGATLPAYALTLEDALGAPINLTNATSVHLVMRPRVGGVGLDLTMVVVAPAAGTVRRDWQVADTALAGYYDAYAWITWNTGAKQRVPSGDTLTILVTPRLA